MVFSFAGREMSLEQQQQIVPTPFGRQSMIVNDESSEQAAGRLHMRLFHLCLYLKLEAYPPQACGVVRPKVLPSSRMPSRDVKILCREGSGKASRCDLVPAPRVLAVATCWKLWLLQMVFWVVQIGSRSTTSLPLWIVLWACLSVIELTWIGRARHLKT